MPLGQTMEAYVGWRFRFLAQARIFPLLERLEHVVPMGRRPSIHDLFLRRLRRDAEGLEYFDINGSRIYFRPEHAVVDEDRLLGGITLILRESYASAPEFFTSETDVRPGDVVFDLGANIGTTALLFSRAVGEGGRVFAFEPVFHHALRLTLEANGADNVQVVPQAVSDSVGEGVFSLTDLGIDSRLTARTDSSGGQRIPLVTLDAFVENEGIDRVDFIKMDIEGAEEMAIRGARRLVERCRPKWTIASYHTDPGGEKQHPKLVRLLRAMGYQVHEVGHHRIHAW